LLFEYVEGLCGWLAMLVTGEAAMRAARVPRCQAMHFSDTSLQSLVTAVACACHMVFMIDIRIRGPLSLQLIGCMRHAHGDLPNMSYTYVR
jgi:hypothetical protein